MLKKSLFAFLLGGALLSGAMQLVAGPNSCEDLCYIRLENCWAKGINPYTCSVRYTSCMDACQ